MLLKPGERYEHNGEVRRFPDIRMVWWAGGTPSITHRIRTGCGKRSRCLAIVVYEINWTATARHADIVLPVAAPQERVDFCAGKKSDNTLAPMPRPTQPRGEVRVEYDI